jgi:Gametolysin peptidase M11
MKTHLSILLFFVTLLAPKEAGGSHLRFQSEGEEEVDRDPSASINATRNLQVVYSTRSLGTRSFYFVRVSAVDATPHPFSLQQWIDVHFRTNGTSFKTVLEACSFGKLKLIINGGLDVTVDGSYKDYARPSDWLDAAVAKAGEALGKDVYTMADHIVFCQPRNATWWTAIGPQNGNRINMHATTCNSLSALAHEFGHNLNLLHSAEGTNKYGDLTGFMGASFGASDGPRKCFNGYKHYQLRWFENRHLNLSDFTTPRKVLVAAFADYDKTTAAHSVIVNVGGMFFLQYNRAKGINEGTAEMKDLVTVTANTPSFSVLLRGLGVGQSHTRALNGKVLYVSACRRIDATRSTQPDVMEIAIGYGRNWCKFI